MKRHTPLADWIESHHTLNVDITGQTFVDANFRFASRKDGMIAYMSSPSAGLLGLSTQLRSPSQLYGKMFSRYLSSPGKDTEIFTTKVSLRNPEKLFLQTSWNMDFLHDLIEGTKKKIPAMTDAVLKFINKYHTYHFGFDLNRGGMKLKKTLSNVIEKAHHEVSVSFDTQQGLVQNLANVGKDMYRNTSDSLMSMSVQDALDKLVQKARQVMKHGDDKIKVLLYVVIQLLSDTKLIVPGSERTLSVLEIFQQTHRSLSRAIDRASQRFASLLKNMKEVKVTIPGTDIVVNGNEIMDKLKSYGQFVYNQLRHPVFSGFSFLYKTMKDLFQVNVEKAENFISYLKDENLKITPQVEAIYLEVLQSSEHHTEEAKRYVAEYKDQMKLNIDKVYNDLRMEQVNNGTREVISILESHLHGGLKKGVDLMRRASQSTAPYLRVGHKKMEMEIPLPFLWKSFSEWPTQFKQ